MDETGEVKRVKRSLVHQMRAFCDLLAAAPDKTMLIKELQTELGLQRTGGGKILRNLARALQDGGMFQQGGQACILS